MNVGRVHQSSDVVILRIIDEEVLENTNARSRFSQSLVVLNILLLELGGWRRKTGEMLLLFMHYLNEAQE